MANHEKNLAFLDSLKTPTYTKPHVQSRVVRFVTLLVVLLLALCFLFPLLSHAANPSVLWQKQFGGAGNEVAYSIVKVDDGYVVAGSVLGQGSTSIDALLIKTDFSGNQLWSTQFGTAIGSEVPNDIIKVSDGFMIAGSFSTAGGMYPVCGFWLAKTSLSGTLLWNKTYGSWSSVRDSYLVQSSSGFYIGCTTGQVHASSDIWVASVDNLGLQLWNKTIEMSSAASNPIPIYYVQDSLGGMVKTSDGFTIVGDTSAQGTSDLLLISMYSYNSIKLNKTLTNAPNEYACGIALTDDGYILAGYTYALGNNDFLLAKTNLAGAQLWNKTYGTSNSEVCQSLVQNTDGFLLAGNVANPTSSDILLVRTNTAGTQLWTKTIGDSSTENAYDAIQDDNNFVIVGSTNSAGNNDFLIVKLTEPTPLSVVVSADSTSATVGETITLTAAPSGGLPSFSYQWYEGSTPLTGQTSEKLSVSKAVGAYTYYCRVTDAASQTANSNSVTVTFSTVPPTTAPPTTPPPTTAPPTELLVSVNPSTKTVGAGQTATFTATASGGTTPYIYQWYQDTTLIEGQNQATLIISQTQTGTYTYNCEVTDKNEQTSTSNNAVLTVTSQQQFTASAITTKTEITTSESTTVTASASGGTEPYTYQWYENTNPITGKTQTQLTLTNCTQGTHTYYCKITDANGATTNSNQITLTVNPQASSTPTQQPTPAGFPVEAIIAIVAVIAVVAALIIIKLLKRPKKPTGPAQIRVTAEPSNIIADGQTKSVITLQLLDKKGNPIPAPIDWPINISAGKGQLAEPVVTIPKGKDTQKTTIVSPTESGPAPISADSEGLKSITITLNFTERNRYCMHCGTMMPLKAKICNNCGNAPPAGSDTKPCQNCQATIPVVAKFCSECGAGQQT